MLRTHTQRWALALAAMLVLPAFAMAQDADPALGVARVSLINGDVTSQRGDSGDWIEATVNLPLVEGDTLATGERSRAEIQLDFANFLRLADATAVRMIDLENRVFRVELLEGSVNYSELKNGEADIDIDTPQATVRPQERGIYRVEQRGGETLVTVRRGRAEIVSTRGSEIVRQGDTMIIRGDYDAPEFRVVDAGPRDGFDDWIRERDRRFEKSRSYDYVSRDITGANDLDDHGDWRYVSGYGRCWYPRGVAAGWAPYRSGRWHWMDYYGWSWIGYEPWGWAPYHYGRWFHSARFGWGWHPGYYRARHYWRPALVSFFGYSGRNFSIGVGLGYGGLGWVPLAPGERYHPWYGRGYYGRNRVNQTIVVDNSVNIYNTYRNARINNGVTVVDSASFSRGLVNQPRSLRASELRRASAIRGQIPVVPDRSSLGSVRTANARATRLATTRTARSATATRNSNRIQRVSFDQQRSAIGSSVRSFRTSSRTATTANGVRGSTTTRSTGTRATVRTPTTRSGSRTASRSTNSGWRTVGSSNTRGTNRVGTTTRSTTRPGVGTRSSSRTTSRSGVTTRSNSRTGSSTRSTSPRSTTRSTSRTSPTSRTSTTRGTSRSTTRSTSPRVSTPSRSTTRSSSRATSRSRVSTPSSSRTRSSTRSTTPRTSSRSTATRSRTNSRIVTPNRSSTRSTSPRSSRSTTVVPSRSRTRSSSRSSSPSRSSSRASSPRSSRPSYSRSAPSRSASPRSSSRPSYGRSAPSRSSSPRMSSPSRSSSPRMSSPSRSSSPRMSAPSRSSSPRMSSPRSSGSSGARSSGRTRNN